MIARLRDNGKNLYTDGCSRMKAKKPLKKPFSSLWRRQLFRHPHYFLMLGSFVFLGAMAAFLLMLANITTRQSQDIRQQASEIALPDLVISSLRTERSEYLPTEPIQILVTVKNQGNATAIGPFSVVVAAGSISSSNYPDVGGGFSTNLSVNLPLAAGAERQLVATIPAGQLSPDGYALKAVPDPLAENKVTELYEEDLAFSLYAFTVVDKLSSSTNSSSSSQVSTSSQSSSGPINLYFTSNNKLEFFKEKNNESIDIDDIVAGERYKVRHTARIQSDRKNSSSTDATSITVEFRANDSGVSQRNFALSQLEKTNDGIDLAFETTFSGKTNNVFTTRLDTASTLAESDENDNTLTTTYSYEVKTTTSSSTITVAGCNETCTTNRDCAAGLACTSGRCRNPQATESTTCQQSAGTTTVQKQAEKTATTGQKGQNIASPTSTTTPRPTTTPQATPINNPLETPTPTVDPTVASPVPEMTPPLVPDDTADSDHLTVQDDILGWLSQLPTLILEKLGVSTTINPLWIWLIIGGSALLIILLLLSLLGRRNHTKLPPVPPPTATPKPPVTVAPIRSVAVTPSTPLVEGAGTARTVPVVSSPTPANDQRVPTSSNQPPDVPTGSSTMISRLQARGVIKPSSTPTEPSA